MILQDYLKGNAQDVALRMFYLGNYMLLKRDPGLAETTYLCYFAHSTLEWYPEWELELGMPTAAAPRTAAGLKRPGAAGIYQRAFEKGLVLVNPTKQPIKVQLQRTMHNAIPQGGGKVGADGSVSGADLDDLYLTVLSREAPSGSYDDVAGGGGDGGGGGDDGGDGDGDKVSEEIGGLPRG